MMCPHMKLLLNVVVTRGKHYILNKCPQWKTRETIIGTKILIVFRHSGFKLENTFVIFYGCCYFVGNYCLGFLYCKNHGG